MPQEIYLDNSATTRAYPQVAEIMVDMLLNNYGNPSSLHRKGIEAEKSVKWARETIARVLRVEKEEIYFTSGGTEGNNLIIRGIAESYKRYGRHMITTAIEHPAVLKTFEDLEKRGFEVTYLNVNSNGAISVDDFHRVLRDDTILVSMMHVNNEIGSIMPIAEVGQLLKDRQNTFFHVDAVQSFGKMLIRPKEWGIHLLTVSSHKIHGPKGCGSVYIEKGIRVHPLFTGGKQEKKMRPGTENVPGIVGFGKAVEIAETEMDRFCREIREMKRIFYSIISKQVPGVRLNGPQLDEGAPHIINLSFPGIKGEVLVHALEEKKIFLSTGSACSSRQSEPSHVLRGLMLTPKEIEGGIRASFSLMNSLSEVEEAARQISDTVLELQLFLRR